MNKIWVLVILIVALGTILGVTIFLRHEEGKKGQIVQAEENTPTVAVKDLSITVSYDNNPYKDDVLLVIGGFHLGGESKVEIEKIVSSFRKLGVNYVGPCHCSGDAARQLFKKEYGENFINVGVGRVITMNDLK